jgi:hypothetical protein
LTREEFIAKYGDVKVTFDYYYKYTFSFSGTCDNGNDILVDVGGSSDDIYRLDVGTNEVSIKNLGIVYGLVSKDGVDLESFYSY